MGITFNAFEIFEMAEQIERNGVKFYRKAAGLISDKNAGKILLSLADMEVEHEKIFTEMREKLTPQQRELMIFDPNNEVALYLQAMADGHVFNLKKDLAEQLTGGETVRDILKMAIAAEKDSIVFYLGLKNFVPVKAGKDKIEDIIKEEMNHIVTLRKMAVSE